MYWNSYTSSLTIEESEKGIVYLEDCISKRNAIARRAIELYIFKMLLQIRYHVYIPDVISITIPLFSTCLYVLEYITM